MTDSAPSFVAPPAATDLGLRLGALDADIGVPVERWRFVPRVVVAGRTVVSTTRVEALDEARRHWPGGARVVLWPLSQYHGHLLVAWSIDDSGTAGDAAEAATFVWDRSAWSPYGTGGAG